jgi:hypothetical protein
MSPTAKFHGMISTFTIGTTYWILLHLANFIPPADSLLPWQKAVIAYVTSPAMYALSATGLRWVLDRWRLARQWFLGAGYLEGTWIGCYVLKTGEKLYTVEHFEQTLDRLTITGQSSTENDSRPRFTWTSKSSDIDVEHGFLTYSYSCTDAAAIPSVTFDGIANFKFRRPNSKTAPIDIHGSSGDLIDMILYPNHEILLSREQVEFFEAWNEAKRKTTC